MDAIATTTHAVLARMTINRSSYALATDDMLRAGVWHEAALVEDASLSANWSDAVLRGADVRLTIASREDIAAGGIAATASR